MVPFYNALSPESLQYCVVVPLTHLKGSVKLCEVKQKIINRPFSIIRSRLATTLRLANEDRYINILSEVFSSIQHRRLLSC